MSDDNPPFGWSAWLETLSKSGGPVGEKIVDSWGSWLGELATESTAETFRTTLDAALPFPIQDWSRLLEQLKAKVTPGSKRGPDSSEILDRIAVLEKAMAEMQQDKRPGSA